MKTKQYPRKRIASRHKALNGMRSNVKAPPTKVHGDKTKQISKHQCRDNNKSCHNMIVTLENECFFYYILLQAACLLASVLTNILDISRHKPYDCIMFDINQIYRKCQMPSTIG